MDTVDTNDETMIRDGLCRLKWSAHATSMNAGWHTDDYTGGRVDGNVPLMIALMHSELSEALEAHRKSLMDDHLPNRLGLEVELADCVLRIADLAGLLNLDLAGAVIDKNRFNQSCADHNAPFGDSANAEEEEGPVGTNDRRRD